MILFLADGRLGNQMFQYVFLKTIQRDNEKLIVSGFEDLQEVCEVNDILNLNKKSKWLRVFLFRLCKIVLEFLSNRKTISSISVKHEIILNQYKREDIFFIEEKGLIASIVFVKLGFFQSEEFFNKKIVQKLVIKNIFLQKADIFLSSIPKEGHRVFIHIRRGDYINYKVYGESTLLPLSYYKKQIDWFIRNRENPIFIFLSDEPEFIEKEFAYIDNKVISRDNHYGVDLAIMTKCNSAILSPSSFGWWGNYLMEDRDVVFTPKYWLGFNSKIEYHKKSNLTYAVEVLV